MKLISLLLIALTSITLKASPFTLNNSAAASFEQSDVFINVAANTCNNLGVTNSEILNMAFEAAERYWNTVSTSRLRLQRGNIINVSADFQTEDICTATSRANGSCTPNPLLVVSDNILISCNTNPTNFSNSGEVLAVSLTNNTRSDQLVGSLILLNDLANNAFQDQTRDGQITVLAHELGHAIGLGHSGLNTDLMFFQNVAGRQRLGRGDIQGVTWLYPVQQPFSGCGSIDLDHGNNTQQLFTMLLGLMLIFMLKKAASVLD